MTAPAQKMDRTQGLGGSDMSALLGVETYKVDGVPKNALHIYLEKVGEAPPRESTLAMRLGQRFEDGIAQEWAEEHGLKVRRKNIPVVAPGHPLMQGNVDRMIVGTGEGLEVKASSSEGWGESDTDEIPQNLLPQIHHYLTAMPSAPRWRVAALLWGQYGRPPVLKSYTIERDPEMSAILVECAEKFWRDHVEPRVPPDPTSSEQANLLWRRSTVGRTTAITPEVLAAMTDLLAEKEIEKASKNRRDSLELILKTHLQDAEVSVDEAEKPLFSWKSQSSKRFQQKEFQEAHPDLFAEFVGESHYRVLRILKLGKQAAEMVNKEVNNAQNETEAG